MYYAKWVKYDYVLQHNVQLISNVSIQCLLFLFPLKLDFAAAICEGVMAVTTMSWLLLELSWLLPMINRTLFFQLLTGFIFFSYTNETRVPNYKTIRLFEVCSSCMYKNVNVSINIKTFPGWKKLKGELFSDFLRYSQNTYILYKQLMIVNWITW